MASVGTRAVEAVRRAGVAHVIREYQLPVRTGRERDARPSYGLDAAAALGLDPARVFLVATITRVR